ncbi:beta-L-arabinofuranosidase domain-containing protein [Paenibacillus pabuli]|uniref:beta-L-arabinofuranosidase domain-containing protein n=1 Tax=Paenibacillus pabuli TaxID=1472 RepID=UPI001FDF1081|nr:beta-L-arabinofuranosidase domain-containing protein [Paenibacillus pabuli]MEC0125235.1 glycoside hydrolase family 127 protein [Paenibacillus pabuli]
MNFGLNEVELKDDDFASRRQLVKSYMTSFDINRLMHTFRLNAGAASYAEPLGGWEAEDCALRGHFVGHFLSACAKFAFADQDQSLKVKANEIVNILESCTKPNGYLSAFGEEELDRLETEENRKVWAPYYTLHKIMQGLIDSHVYLCNQKALKLAVNLAHYIHGRFTKLSFWKIDGILRCTRVNPMNEFGGMGDALYSLYELTDDPELLELASLFDRDYFLAPLADGQDVLENLHANAHLPMVISALHRHEITNEEKYKTAVLYFYDFVQGRTFANGNSSSKATAYIEGGVSEKSEHWGGYERLEDALTGGESESCCAHNTERILERLVGLTGKVEYLDHLEQLKYNAILNSASCKTGLSQYHQPMGSGASKRFSSPYNDFWCCTASGVEAMSELQRNIWFRSENTLLLNAFISSTVVWDEHQARIRQYTDFPDRPTSTLQFEMAQPATFALLLKEKAVKSIKINSVALDVQKENGYIVIQREFHDGDTLDIEIEVSLHLVPLQGSNSVAAVMYGTILLAQLGQAILPSGISEHHIIERMSRLPQQKLAFAIEDQEGQPVEFKPLFRIEEETYSVYVNWGDKPAADQRFSVAQVGIAAYKEDTTNVHRESTAFS